MVYILIIVLLVCLFLWFYKVQKNMEDCFHTVESAAEQLASVQNKAIEKRGNPYLNDELMQSERNYAQAVRLYHLALGNPFNRLPAALMGFRRIKAN